jgi:hypothetical protein
MTGRLWEAGDRRTAGDDQREAFIQLHGAQGGQDGRYPDLGHQQPVEQAAEAGDRHRHQHAQQHDAQHDNPGRGGHGGGGNPFGHDAFQQALKVHRPSIAQAQQHQRRGDTGEIRAEGDRKVDAAAQHGDHHGQRQHAELGKLEGHLLDVGPAEELRGLQDGQGREHHDEGDDVGGRPGLSSRVRAL